MISQSSKGPQTQAKALLNAYLSQLAVRPLRTKMATSGVLSFLQEVLASRLARLYQQPAQKATAVRNEPIVSSKAWKMAIYGAFVSAPMGHFLIGTLQKSFAGKTSKLARFGQVLASNIFVAPVQAFVYLFSMCVINGLRDPQAILQSVKARFFFGAQDFLGHITSRHPGSTDVHSSRALGALVQLGHIFSRDISQHASQAIGLCESLIPSYALIELLV